MIRVTPKDEKRFFSYCELADDGLLYWSGYKDRAGYGVFRLHGKDEKAHRVAFVIFTGDIPPGMCVLHHNDRPSCVDPSALYMGTQKENIRDREKRGRGARGERNGRAKLSARDVMSIRKGHGEGRSITALGEEYGVSQCCISDIIHRRKWAWLKKEA